MPQINFFLTELQHAVNGEPWHGKSLAALLRDVDATSAAAHPLPGGHSIWEIVLHLTVWTSEVARRLQGHTAQVPAEEDWPVVGDTSPAAWTRTQTAFGVSNTDLKNT